MLELDSGIGRNSWGAGGYSVFGRRIGGKGKLRFCGTVGSNGDAGSKSDRKATGGLL